MKEVKTKHIVIFNLFLMILAILSCQPSATNNSVSIDIADDKLDDSDISLNPIAGVLKYESNEFILNQYFGVDKTISPIKIPYIEGIDTIYSIEDSTGDLSVHLTTTAVLVVDLTYPGEAEFTLRAEIEGHGYQRQQIKIIVAAAPGNPTNISIETYDAKFNLTWEAPEQLGTDRDVGMRYRIYYAQANIWERKPSVEEFIEYVSESILAEEQEESGKLTGIGITRETNIELNGLEVATRYYIVVEAQNSLINTITSTATERLVVHVASTSLERLNGFLSYGTNMFQYAQYDDLKEIIPENIPSKENAILNYSIEHKEGIDFGFGFISIDSNNIPGRIRVNPQTDIVGTATYTVRVYSLGYEELTLDISIEILPIRVQAYNGQEGTFKSWVYIGQGALDDSLGLYDTVLTVSNLIEGENYTVVLTKYGSLSKVATVDGEVFISRKDFLDNGFTVDNINNNQHDDLKIKIQRGNLSLQNIARYKGLEIRSWHDLQSMRLNLDGHYKIVNDIVFPELSTFEAVGTDSTPFTGTLKGRNDTNTNRQFRISGLKINNGDRNYQGLFGVMENEELVAHIAENFMIYNPIIFGKSYVGSLAGEVRRGTIHSVNVRVEVSELDGLLYSQIKLNGSISSNVFFGNVPFGYGGGLIGKMGSDVVIQNSSSEVPVYGNSEYATSIGGLVGYSSGVITGAYATGNVDGEYHVGGLIGFNRGTTYGFATGDVSASHTVGGLVGTGDNRAPIYGYSIGTVTGDYNVGGLIGKYNTHSQLINVVAYTRSNVIRKEGTSVHFGRVSGNGAGNVSDTYHSAASDESNILEFYSQRPVLHTTGKDGNSAIDISTVTNEIDMNTMFSRFIFGTGPGEWTWVGSGKWPALNIGSIALENNQPIE